MIPSVIVLTHNSQKSIKQALRSASFSDDLIVVDNHSTDETLRLSHYYTTRTYSHPQDDNWATQRNFALSKAKHPWVLFIDSDEIISPTLRRQIISLPSHPKENGFYIPRLDKFLGRYIHHGEMGNIQIIRLGRKKSGIWKRPVHEVWQLTPPIGKLSAPLLHHRDINLQDFLNRLNRYTDLDVPALLKEHKPFSWLDLMLKPLGKFIYNYIYLLGFLDGYPGLISSYYMSLNSLITRIKLWEVNSAI